jgi:pimeloyl-ACP methyl ester carboxylesterase
MQPIVFSHATGFHGRVFSPVVAHLSDFSCTTFDYRGYGDTAAPADWTLSWEGFGDDALAIARYVAAQHSGTPLVGVGHSMGGAGLVMAALREPRLFAALVLFEPIIFPPEVRTQAGRGNPLAEVTRRRRTTFGSFEDAIDNFSSKPPLSSLHRDALDAYVRFGFTQHADGVHIKCHPEFEARTYEMGAMHDTWLALDQLRVPTWVMAGRHADHSPAAIAPRIAERIPNSTFVEWRPGSFWAARRPCAVRRVRCARGPYYATNVVARRSSHIATPHHTARLRWRAHACTKVQIAATLTFTHQHLPWLCNEIPLPIRGVGARLAERSDGARIIRPPCARAAARTRA